jgi:hypothetical protein
MFLDQCLMEYNEFLPNSCYFHSNQLAAQRNESGIADKTQSSHLLELPYEN